MQNRVMKKRSEFHLVFVFLLPVFLLGSMAVGVLFSQDSALVPAPRAAALMSRSYLVEHLDVETAAIQMRQALDPADARVFIDRVKNRVVIKGNAGAHQLAAEPATHFLPEEVELADDGGVVVDERLRTSAEDVHAAGDVATYPDPILGRTRVEHVDNATTMGAAAGRIMAGSEETYDHTPMFYSDVLGLGYQAVGTLDSSLETFVERVGDGAVAYYLDDREVRGVLLWDLDEGVEEAKALLARHSRPADPADLAGTITG